ncbi:probable 2-ketogluconate reductase [Dysidea avara]|uniref:probable 2-ketogluconate reductase n=1 Tax=Dysidea avara TaxID=196820 RepID=UPI00331DAE3B
MSAGRYYVYQSTVIDNERLQQQLDDSFNIVTSETLEEHKNKIVAICSIKRTAISGDLIRSLPALKVIACNSVGYDHVDMQAATELGIRVGHSPYVVDDATADIAMTLLLGSARRIIEGDKIARDPSTVSFPGNRFLGQEVSGSTIGIVGMGRIGSKIAKRASKGFDMKVVYHNRQQKSAEEEHTVCATYVPVLNELLQQCDFVVLAAPSTKETYRMMGREQFKAMKKTGIFINIARGALVDHGALVEALRDGEIAHAGLDVTDPEPLPRDHPLLTMSNITFTPHLGTATYATRKKLVEVVIGNIMAGVKGEPLLYEVPETKNNNCTGIV